MQQHKGRISIIVTFTVLFTTVFALLLMIFFAGKKTYVVQFDLNGGTLISGVLEQHVTRGQDAVPPTVVKDGAYLRSWSTSYRQITKDVVIEAIWEYETTAGIIYSDEEDQNFAEIKGAYKYIGGEIYLGAYYNNKKILGICDKAFFDCTKITKVYLLEGLLSIGEEAFAGCVSLSEIEIPETVTHLLNGAFRGCESLETLILYEGLMEIGAGAFADCTALKEVVLPASLVRIGENAFAGCEDLVIRVSCTEEDAPEGWADGWQGSATVIWLEKEESAEDVEEDGAEGEETKETEKEAEKEASEAEPSCT